MKSISHPWMNALWLLSALAELSACRVYNSELVALEPVPTAPLRGDAATPELPLPDAGCCKAPSTSREAGVDCEQDDAGCASPEPPMPPRRESGEVLADLCPDDPAKTVPGVCGCGVIETDRDGDGAFDCMDGCPDDALKTAPGVCGCASVELDSDRDGTADCVDGCPRDGAKTASGACGCGQVEPDSDEDGAPDCVDECPEDPAKAMRGVCGCGASDPADPVGGELYCVREDLRHRYSFSGEGPRLVDSIAGFDTALERGVNASQYAGALELSGDLGPGYVGEGYAQLPEAVLRDLGSATFEVWFVWRGPGRGGETEWQRIFDFGAQDQNGRAMRYLYLTVEGKGGVRAAFSLAHEADPDEAIVGAPQPAARDVMQHVALVLDREAGVMQLYCNGHLEDSAALQNGLAELQPAHLWLGRSSFDDDPELNGSLLELRIYGRALSTSQLAASAAAGPDYTF